MKKILIHAFLLMLLVSNAWALDIRIEGERISLHAVQEPLRNILQSMALQGIKVRLDPHVNPIVSATYENRDIADVIAAIVKPYDHALIWERTSQQPSSFRLSEIQVFRPGQKQMIQDLHPRAFVLAKDQQKGTLFVKDVILLRVKPGTDIQKYLRMVNGSIIDKNEALGIYKVRVPPGSDIAALVAMINALPDVQAGPDFAYPVPPSYRADLLLPSAEIAKTFRGDGKVPVAVLDSGLMSGIGPDGFVIASLDAVMPSQPISDAVGHGTQMALIASGLITPMGVETGDGGGQIPVVAIRAMDDNGYTTDFTILKGIDFAIEKGAMVISLSWGSEQQSAFMAAILENAAAKGIIVVASAGNEPTGKPVYPAAYPSVIGVGAEYPNGKAWEQSNYGSFVAISAPGFAVLPVGYKGSPGIYGGTSISAAYIANRIADYLSNHPGSSVEQVKKAVQTTKVP